MRSVTNPSTVHIRLCSEGRRRVTGERCQPGFQNSLCPCGKGVPMALMTQVCVMLRPHPCRGSGLRPALSPGRWEPRPGHPCRAQCRPSCLPFLADKRAFFIICTSELGPPQIYELVALTSSDKNT